MPTPHTQRPRKPVRRVRRYRYRRVLALLLALLGTELAWRTGAFAHTRAHRVHAMAAAARASGATHQHTSTAQPSAHVDLSAGPPLAGPPVTTPERAQSTLQHLVSVGFPVCRR